MPFFTTNFGGDGGIPSLLTVDAQRGWDLNGQIDTAMEGAAVADYFYNPEGVGFGTEAAGAAGGASASLGAVGGVGLGLAIGQLIGGAISAYSQSKTASVVSKAQERVARANQKIAQLGAETALRTGESQVAQITYNAGQTKARQRAAFAANGVALGEGSVNDVLTTTDALKELDVRNTQMNALANSWNYRRQAISYGVKAQNAHTMSNYYDSNALGSAFGSLISNGGQVASSWYRYRGS